jgi:transposase
LRPLRENVPKRHPELWREQTWLLHHDNAPFHTSVVTQQFLAKMAVIPNPPYSPALAPCDFIFPKMKLKLKGRRFDTTEDIQAESQRVLGTLTENGFQERSKNGGDGDTGVYMRDGTTSRMMAADRPYGEFYYFYSVCPQYFEYKLVYN